MLEPLVQNILPKKELLVKLFYLDIKEGFAEGKALDLFQTATTLGFNTPLQE